MNGYSTGWKFNGWYTGTSPTTALGDGTFTNDKSGIVTNQPNLSWKGQITDEPQATYAINVHGYNSIRLRFPMVSVDGTAASGSGNNLAYPVAWHIFLIDSDVEPDQTSALWMASNYCTLMTTWPVTSSVPTGSSTTHTDFVNVYGKPWVRLANAVRLVQGHGSVGSLREIAPTSPTSSNPAYGYIGNTFAGVLGSYSSLQPHNIVSATGLPGADIYSDAALCPTYSPSLGAAQTNNAGEIYINNLGGCQYLLCVPIASYGYLPDNTKYVAPTTATTGNGKAKCVGVMYNLLQ